MGGGGGGHNGHSSYSAGYPHCPERHSRSDSKPVETVLDRGALLPVSDDGHILEV